MILSERDLERFNSKVMPEPNSGCHLWLDSLSEAGYGQFSYEGAVIGAHVISHWQFKGPVKPGYEVHHRCRIRCCVNADHLEAMSFNEHRRLAKIALQRKSTALGRYLAAHNISGVEFARRIGVTQACISRYVRGERFPKQREAQLIFAETRGAVSPNDFLRDLVRLAA